MTVVERSHCATVTRRRAAKQHRCECGQRVPKGEMYLLHKGFPGHDSLSDIAAPMTLVECFRCAARYGRDHLLGPDAPDPEDQDECANCGGGSNIATRRRGES